MMSLMYPADSLLNTTQPAIDVYLSSKQDDGQIAGLTYWQVANGYAAVALHDTWSNSSANVPVLVEAMSHVAAQQPDCINSYNDDSMWWAMAFLDLYQLSADADHLAVARNVWDHVQHYVIGPGEHVVNGMDMAGGVLWTDLANETQVNAITTGLFAELSARLATLDEDTGMRQRRLQFAVQSLSWILACRFQPDESLVLDHIDLDTGATVDWVFTYNTGQAIAALVALYDAVRQTPIPASLWSQPATQLALACNMSRRAMSRPAWVDADGTLTERGVYPGTGADQQPAWENSDAVGFKPILLRSLARLCRILRRDGVDMDLHARLADFITWQFGSLRMRDTNGHAQYGPWWAGPMDLPTSHSQLAALDVMAAIHAVG